ncbi:hypothetical protein [Silvanigrella aquatica]|uniref:Uncharacterized protein n=1 Tax=Silvanigrella aquatica TaxID=1915309 RepID=A0A1L4CX30_9BACT|nr:hypothetical protein [Silvanigrella aquatica]APJ02504.1 hypothetical protein AXG55_00570 [Silvanigrella aquatica]
MQGKVFENNFIEGMDFEKVENLRQIYEWIQLHTEICHLYAQLSDEQEKAKFKDKVEASMNRGKLLLETVFSDSNQHHKPPLIPLSGMNRFANNIANHDLRAIGKHESVTNVLTNSFKSELGTVANVKKRPMPSRTYLRKK